MIELKDMAKLEDIASLPSYLTNYGSSLARKAIKSLRPLHVPGKDVLPEFEDYPDDRMPMDAQQHVAAACIKAIDKHGAVFINGEPGVGKTITSIAAVHEHAMRSRRKGGHGGKYRAVVICPDTLVRKWVREIESTIPDAHVVTIGLKKDKWSDILAHTGKPDQRARKTLDKGEVKQRTREVATITNEFLFDKACREEKWEEAQKYVSTETVTSEHKAATHQDRKRWERPWHVEWLVLGRDKIKRAPDSSGLGSKRLGFDKTLHENEPRKLVEVDRKDVLDENGYRQYKPGTYQTITKGVYEKRLACPKCGKVPMEKNKPLTSSQLGEKQTRCEGRILYEVTKTGRGNDCLYEGMNYSKYRGIGDETFPSHARRVKTGSKISHAGKSWLVTECGEPLYQYVHKRKTWPAAQIIQRKMRGWHDYMIIDECHQMKSEVNAQTISMSKVLANSKHVIAMTGTLIGGYASHLFPLLIRLAGKEMKERGFQWLGTGPFIEKYGCIDRITTATVPVNNTKSVRMGNSKSLAKKIGSVDEKKRPRPGIMPTLFSHLMMKRAVFLKLDQFIDCLPGFHPQMHAIEMDSDIQFEYNRVAADLEGECSKMLAQGNMKLLGAMLWTLLSYPDNPFDWSPRFPGDHAVGWWKLPKVFTQENYVGVTTPRNFDPERMLPKELACIEKCKEYASKKEQTWIYTLLNKVHSPVTHLKDALEKEGLRVGVLASDDASPSEREAYIDKVGKDVDVMISHPGLVATGLDLFNYAAGFNFNHLMFFQTGYDLFTVRQAERRGWRIGQELDCTVDYFYYLGTMQAAAMQLMSRKMMAAMQLEEGRISEEGLAAMCGGGDQAALINAISEVIDPKDIERNWGRSQGGTGKKIKRPTKVEPMEVEEEVEDEIEIPVIDFDNAGDEDVYEAEELGVVIPGTPDDDDDDDLDDDDMDFDEDDLQAMFANLDKKSDVLDW